MEKFRIMVDDVVLAIKFDAVHKQFVIGGNKRYRRNMLAIIVEYFGRPSEDFTLRAVQRNKIRYDGSMSPGAFDTGIDLMRTHGFYVESVTNLGTLMR